MILIGRMILNSKFIKSTGKNNASIENLINYISTREGVELTKEKEWEIINSTKGQKELIGTIIDKIPDLIKTFEYEEYIKNSSIKNAFEFIYIAKNFSDETFIDKEKLVNYMSERPGVYKVGKHGLFSIDNEEIDLELVKKNISNHEGNIWTNIISLKREDAEKLSLNNQEAWKNIVQTQSINISKSMNIGIDNLKMYGAFHNESHHPHIHLVVYSKDPKEGYLTNKGLEKIKAGFAHEIFKDEFLHAYKEKDIVNENLNKYILEKMKNIINEIEKNKIIEIESDLGSMLIDLSKKLENVKGKKVYGYLNKSLKNDVNKILEEIVKDTHIQELYNSFADIQKSILNIYKDKEVSIAPLMENKKIANRIRNMILKEAVKISETNEEILEDINSGSYEKDLEIQKDKFLFEKIHDTDYEDIYEDIYPKETKETQGEKDKYIPYEDIYSKETEDTREDIYPKEKIYIKEVDCKNDIEQYKLGKQYILGEEIEKNIEKGLDLITKSAEQGNKYALYFLGKEYLKGEIVEKDIDIALNLINKSIERGNKYAQYFLGREYLKGKIVEKDIDKALYLLNKSAKQENEHAQYFLGKEYLKGEIVGKDIEKAMTLLNKSVDLGNHYALYSLLKLYLKDEDIKKGRKKALDLLNKAVEEKNDYAQYSLGKEYIKGEIVEKDIPKALDLLTKSTEQGNEHAQYFLGKEYLKGEIVRKDIPKALDLLNKSAEQGNEHSQYFLGKEYLRGEIIKKDIPKALELLTKSAEQGNAYAQYFLGREYIKGEIVKKDVHKALELLNKSAEEGNSNALASLGALYLKGEDVKKDIPKALELLNKSIEKNDAYAQYVLGKAYYFGKDVKKDTKKGKYLLEKSAEQGNEYAKKMLEFISKLEINSYVNLLKNICDMIYIQSNINNYEEQDKKLTKKLTEKKISQGQKLG